MFSLELLLMYTENLDKVLGVPMDQELPIWIRPVVVVGGTESGESLPAISAREETDLTPAREDIIIGANESGIKRVRGETVTHEELTHAVVVRPDGEVLSIGELIEKCGRRKAALAPRVGKGVLFGKEEIGVIKKIGTGEYERETGDEEEHDPKDRMSQLEGVSLSQSGENV